MAETDSSNGASVPIAVALSALAVVVPMVLAASTAPSPTHPRIWLWYASLRKPRWKPPDAAIPIAWAGIDSLLAGAAYRLLRQGGSPARNRALGLLAANALAIGGWSRLFFGGRDLKASTLAAGALAVSGAAFVAQASRSDRAAAAAGVPLVVWVAFATVLTARIWRLNR